MQRKDGLGYIEFDMEDGEFVTIWPGDGTFEYADTLSPDKWNTGVFNVQEGRCYIIASTETPQAAVIRAFRALYDWVEWVVPKEKKRRVRRKV